MFNDLHIHKQIRGSLLDQYLAKGWYRMGQVIFTTDYLFKDERWYRVFWLRYRLKEFQFSARQRKLLQLPKGCTAGVKPLRINAELEELYGRYRDHLDFEISPALKENLNSLDFLGQAEGDSVFDSYVIEIRREEKLIAAGIFDLGDSAMAGIINIYDPAERRLSPGKRLMQIKLSYALSQKLDYYYPGYIVCGNPKFDYKLEPGREICEIFNPVTDSWLPYSAETILAWKDTPDNPFAGDLTGLT